MSASSSRFLKRLISPVAADVFLPTLRDTMMPCAPASVGIDSDCVSARHSPNVIRNECSSVAWYGSFRFSMYIFQLLAISWRL